MARTRWPTILVLSLAVVVSLVAVVHFAFSGPTFRAGEHASYEECIRNIPREWGRGSLEHTRAEAACVHAHRQQAP